MDTSELTLLKLASVLGSAPIPVAIFDHAPADPPGRYPSADALAAALEALVSDGAITREGAVLTVDPARREGIRAVLGDDVAWRRAAARLLLAAMPPHVDVTSQPDAWITVRPLVPHVDALAKDVGPGHPLAAEVAALHAAVGWALGGFGDFRGALERHRTALGLREHLDDDALDTARSHQDVAVALVSLGRGVESQAHLEKAVEIRRREQGDAHPLVVTSLVALGAARAQGGDIDGARATAEEALALARAALGESHPVTITARLSVSGLLRLVADRERDQALSALQSEELRPSWEAVTALNAASFSQLLDSESFSTDFARRAVDFTEALTTADHPAVASALVQLGAAQEHGNELAGARLSYERAVELLARHGADSPFADRLLSGLEAHARLGLGTTLEKLGEVAAAKESLERALALYDESPDDLPQLPVVLLLDALGRVLTSLGDLAGARAHYERATEIDRSKPDAMPYLVSAGIRDRARDLVAHGDVEGGVASFDRSIAVLEEAGEDELWIKEALQDAGDALREHDALAAALAYYERLRPLTSAGFDVTITTEELDAIIEELRGRLATPPG